MPAYIVTHARTHAHTHKCTDFHRNRVILLFKIMHLKTQYGAYFHYNQFAKAYNSLSWIRYKLKMVYIAIVGVVGLTIAAFVHPHVTMLIRIYVCVYI